MKVLIVGGTGLISTAIARALRTRNAEVTVFNRGRTEDRLDGDIRHLRGDRNDAGAFEATVRAEGPWDAVIDMICFRPEQAASDVRAFAGQCGHFVFCSTVCTYGNTQTLLPTPESTPQTPHSQYGTEKLACEKIFLEAHASGRMPVTILRPAHTYGSGRAVASSLGYLPTFLGRLRRGLPVIVSGDGHGLWQTTYVDDVAAGFAHALGRPRCFGQAYNVVGDLVMTWDQYTERVAAAIGAPPPVIVHLPSDLLLAIDRSRFQTLDEIYRFHAVYSNARIKRDIPEFRPATPFETGIRRAVEWTDHHGGGAVTGSDEFEDRLLGVWDTFRREALAGLSTQLREI